MNNSKIFEILHENGFVTGFLYFLVSLIAIQIWKNRDRITEAIIYEVTGWSRLAKKLWIERHIRYIDKVEGKISKVYTHLYSLRDLSPVRVEVLKFQYFTEKELGRGKKPENQYYKSWIIHEAIFMTDPIKELHQGIVVDNQALDYLIVKTLDAGRKGILVDLDEIEEGELKDEYLSEGLRSFFSILINRSQKKDHVYTIVLKFNLSNSLEAEDVARIRICSQNIGKLMFGDE